MNEKDFPISRLLWGVTLFEVGVLAIAGIGPFVAPALFARYWPWQIAPFNLRFLAAVYTTAMIVAALQVYYARWSPARLVTSMIFLFTTVVLIVSLFYLNRFPLELFIPKVFFFLYIVLPLNAGLHLWLYRDRPPAGPPPDSPATRTLLRIEAALLGLYGLALLILPAASTRFWPWPIDDMHARIYSATFLAPALGVYLLSRGATPKEWLTMGISALSLGFFPLLALVLVDMQVRRVNWSLPGTWLWIGIFVAILLRGVWMLLRGRARQAERL